MRRTAPLLLLFFSLFAACSFGQGINNTTQSKTDWEEINFEFNSAILTDGYPSLLRLADILKEHQDYRVRVVGNTDRIGSTRYNERLGQRRAEEVKRFLVKYGASASSVSTETRGKGSPEVNGRSKEARFINRRVMLTVTDATGKPITEGTIGQVIDNMGMSKKCCDDILARLDKLEDLLNKLGNSIDANNKGMQAQIDALNNGVKGVQRDVTTANTEIAKRPDANQVTNIVDTESMKQIRNSRDPRFSIMALNIGSDDLGGLTFTGRGRYFAPVGKLFGENIAVQAQGEYMYFRDRQEAQFDFGLVNRAGRFQGGLFGSFKHIQLGQYQNGGNLGQAAATLDFILPRGKVGIFGTKGFLNSAVLDTQIMNLNTTRQTYASIVDQVGFSTTFATFGPSYIEANLGYLRSRGYADRPGGTLRYVIPVAEHFALTVEGGLNETLLARTQNTRIVGGFLFGNFLRPRDYAGTNLPVPVDVPRVRYELLSRDIRSGNSPPVADAGPDQIGVAAGLITLDGSRTYDPEGDPITYQWTQISGPSVSISGTSTNRATFTADQGQTYSFRLQATDNRGASSIARTTVTTTTPQRVQILLFQANPAQVASGQTSNLSYQVQNATSISISGVTSTTLNPTAGNVQVNPTQTTTYVLTAMNATSSDRSQVTVTVSAPTATISSFSANPSTITAGASSLLTCQTQNAATVTIAGGGVTFQGNSGSVSPAATTTYTCTATSAGGGTPVTATTTVTVNAVVVPTVPTIQSFTAAPGTITSGQSSVLSCQAQNAQTIAITGPNGPVGSNGAATVSPTATTTYTCTATGQSGAPATATVVVTVNPIVVPPVNQPTLAGCVANPTSSPAPGQPVSIAYATTNATAVTISNFTGSAGLNGPVVVSPQATTSYTITATGATGSTPATCTVNVTVRPLGPPPTAIIAGPQVLETIYTQITLDASQSTTPSGSTLTYRWTPLSTGAAVLDQGQAVTRVQFPAAFGDYVFQLTVTDAQGQTATTTVTVRFVKNSQGN